MSLIKTGWKSDNFTMVPNEIWEIPDLSQDEQLVWSYLAMLGATGGGTAFPSYPTLAAKCRVKNKNGEFCKTKTRRVIESLQEKKLLTKANRVNKRNGKFGSNLYTLTHPAKLLKSTKSTDEDEFEIIYDTPCVKLESDIPSNPNEIKAEKFDTPVSSQLDEENQGVEQDGKGENDTYLYLLNNTYLNKHTYREATSEEQQEVNILLIANNYPSKLKEEMLKDHSLVKTISRFNKKDKAKTNQVLKHCSSITTYKKISGSIINYLNDKKVLPVMEIKKEIITPNKDYKAILKGLANNCLGYASKKDALANFDNSIKVDYPNNLVKEYRIKLEKTFKS